MSQVVRRWSLGQRVMLGDWYGTRSMLVDHCKIRDHDGLWHIYGIKQRGATYGIDENPEWWWGAMLCHFTTRDFQNYEVHADVLVANEQDAKGDWTLPAVSNGGVYYRCRIGHFSAVAKEPGVGADWEQYWLELTEAPTTSSAWAAGNHYGWNSDHIWAPDVIENPEWDETKSPDDSGESSYWRYKRYVMAYTGVVRLDLPRSHTSAAIPIQKIGFAYSDDLFNWYRDVEAIYEPGDYPAIWTWPDDNDANFRDPNFFYDEENECWTIACMAQMASGDFCIARIYRPDSSANTFSEDWVHDAADDNMRYFIKDITSFNYAEGPGIKKINDGTTDKVLIWHGYSGGYRYHEISGSRMSTTYMPFSFAGNDETWHIAYTAPNWGNGANFNSGVGTSTHVADYGPSTDGKYLVTGHSSQALIVSEFDFANRSTYAGDVEGATVSCKIGFMDEGDNNTAAYPGWERVSGVAFDGQPIYYVDAEADETEGAGWKWAAGDCIRSDSVIYYVWAGSWVQVSAADHAALECIQTHLASDGLDPSGLNVFYQAGVGWKFGAGSTPDDPHPCDAYWQVAMFGSTSVLDIGSATGWDLSALPVWVDGETYSSGSGDITELPDFWPVRVSRYASQGYINTFVRFNMATSAYSTQGGSVAGKVRSDAFTISGDRIRFKLGGMTDPDNETYIALCQGGQKLFTANPSSIRFEWIVWDVSTLKGNQVYFEINVPGGRVFDGWIAVDYIEEYEASDYFPDLATAGDPASGIGSGRSETTKADLYDAVAAKLHCDPEECIPLSTEIDGWALDCLRWLIPLAPEYSVESIMETHTAAIGSTGINITGLTGDVLKVVRVSHEDGDFLTYVAPEKYAGIENQVQSDDYYLALESDIGVGQYGKGHRVWSDIMGYIKAYRTATTDEITVQYLKEPSWVDSNLSIPHGWDGLVASYCAIQMRVKQNKLAEASKLREMLRDELTRFIGFENVEVTVGG